MMSKISRKELNEKSPHICFSNINGIRASMLLKHKTSFINSSQTTYGSKNGDHHKEAYFYRIKDWLVNSEKFYMQLDFHCTITYFEYSDYNQQC